MNCRVMIGTRFTTRQSKARIARASRQFPRAAAGPALRAAGSLEVTLIGTAQLLEMAATPTNHSVGRTSNRDNSTSFRKPCFNRRSLGFARDDRMKTRAGCPRHSEAQGWRFDDKERAKRGPFLRQGKQDVCATMSRCLFLSSRAKPRDLRLPSRTSVMTRKMTARTKTAWRRNRSVLEARRGPRCNAHNITPRAMQLDYGA